MKFLKLAIIASLLSIASMQAIYFGVGPVGAGIDEDGVGAGFGNRYRTSDYRGRSGFGVGLGDRYWSDERNYPDYGYEYNQPFVDVEI
jgi:hypothetical protein